MRERKGVREKEREREERERLSYERKSKCVATNNNKFSDSLSFPPSFDLVPTTEREREREMSLEIQFLLLLLPSIII